MNDLMLILNNNKLTTQEGIYTGKVDNPTSAPHLKAIIRKKMQTSDIASVLAFGAAGLAWRICKRF